MRDGGKKLHGCTLYVIYTKCVVFSERLESCSSETEDLEFYKAVIEKYEKNKTIGSRLHKLTLLTLSRVPGSNFEQAFRAF